MSGADSPRMTGLWLPPTRLAALLRAVAHTAASRGGEWSR